MWSSVLLVAGLLTSTAAVETGDTSTDDAEFRAAVDHCLTVADLVLERHVDPPARQQMVLGMARELCLTKSQPVPSGFSTKLSSLTVRSEFVSILADLWSELRQPQAISTEEIQAALLVGLLSTVPGEPFVESVKNHQVGASLAENRYVGTGIYLGIREGHPTMVQVFKDGPADVAGCKLGDRIEAVDGKDVTSLSISPIIDLLRGAEGSTVTVVVRQPGEDRAHTVNIIRGLVRLETIHYTLVGGRKQTAHLKFDSVSASAVQELRQFAERAAKDHVRAVIVDLRGTYSGNLHYAMLTADAFLGDGRIGRIHTRHGIREFSANRDSLFRDLPLSVLVDRDTGAAAEWIAAALQTAKQGGVVGQRTRGDGYVKTAIPIPGRDTVVWLPTGIFERGDGTRFLKPRSLRSPATARYEAQRKGVEWGVSPDEHVAPGGPGSEDTVLKRAIEMLDSQLAGDSSSRANAL